MLNTIAGRTSFFWITFAGLGLSMVAPCAHAQQANGASAQIQLQAVVLPFCQLRPTAGPPITITGKTDDGRAVFLNLGTASTQIACNTPYSIELKRAVTETRPTGNSLRAAKPTTDGIRLASAEPTVVSDAQPVYDLDLQIIDQSSLAKGSVAYQARCSLQPSLGEDHPCSFLDADLVQSELPMRAKAVVSIVERQAGVSSIELPEAFSEDQAPSGSAADPIEAAAMISTGSIGTRPSAPRANMLPYLALTVSGRF